MSENIPSNLTVTVKFQVGEAHVPLAELINLAEGSIIEGEPVHTYFPKVKAILDDRVIAEGELVKVGEQVAFRITKTY